MAKEKARIIVMQNGIPVGYVKSVSYTKQKFSITQNKIEAKGYTKAAMIQGEIDFLAKITAGRNLIFIYN